jgi:hypothetical protein
MKMKMTLPSVVHADGTSTEPVVFDKSMVSGLDCQARCYENELCTVKQHHARYHTFIAHCA